MKTYQSLLFIGLLLIVSWKSWAQAPVQDQDRGTITQRLDRIEQIVQSQGLLEMLQQLGSLQQEIKQLRGEIEMQNHNIEQLRDRQRALYTDIDQRLQGMERGSPAATGATATSQLETPPLQTLAPVYSATDAAGQTASSPLTVETVQTPPAQQPVTAPLPGASVQSPQPDPVPSMDIDVDPAQITGDYQKAFDLLKQSRYGQAINAFRTFLGVYPDNEYSDNAQYWLGETYYVMRQYETAIEEYNKLITNYPNSEKYTHAVLKIGFSYSELGQFDKATTYLERLVKDYPGSTAGRLATERLKAIAVASQQQQSAPIEN